MITDHLLHPELFRKRMKWLKWLAPIFLLGLVVFYELVPSRWIHVHVGEAYHYWAEIIFYGILGPALAYLAFILLERWFEERETSDLQATIVAQRQADLVESRNLYDDALQALFAASVIIATLHTNGQRPATINENQIQAAQRAIDGTIKKLRSQLAE